MSNDKFINDLKKEAERYIDILTRMFGPCDEKFPFGCVKITPEKQPRTHFREDCIANGSVIDILITQKAAEDSIYSIGRSTWQIAHECVHLLNPVKQGCATYLEEGLATWFSNCERYHKAKAKQYIAYNKSKVPEHPDEQTQKYIEAEGLVIRYMPQLERAVKKLRAMNKKISKIKSSDLKPLLRSDAKTEDIEKLCSRF